MDYITKPTSRATLRRFSKIVRAIFGCESDYEPFPVLQALEKLPDVVDDASYEVVDDSALPANVFAQCYPKPEGGLYVIWTPLIVLYTNIANFLSEHIIDCLSNHITSYAACQG